jgi:hypothetical protein
LKDSIYTIGFAGFLSTTCTLLLTSAATFTKPYRENNELVEERLNILVALNVPLEGGVGRTTAGKIRAERS